MPVATGETSHQKPQDRVFPEQKGCRQKTRALGTKEIGVLPALMWQMPSAVPRSIDFADELALKPSGEAAVKGAVNTRVDKGVEQLDHLSVAHGSIQLLYWKTGSITEATHTQTL